MSTRQAMQRCSICNKPTMHIGSGVSHVLHLLLSLLTLGLWLPVWLLCSLNQSTAAACTVCGKKAGLLSFVR